MINPFTAMGHFHKQPPRWPTFLAMLFQILKEGIGRSLLDELEVQYSGIRQKFDFFWTTFLLLQIGFGRLKYVWGKV